MKRYNVFLDEQQIKKLAKIAKKKSLKTAQMIRLAISEFIERNEK